MKTINFKKFGILLAMMLVAGAALVGPVSAAESSSYSENGNFLVKAGGVKTSSNYATYYGSATLKVSGSADRIGVTAGLYNYGGYYMGSSSVNVLYDTYAYTNGVYSNQMALDRPYTQTDFSSDDPNDYKYNLRCNL